MGLETPNGFNLDTSGKRVVVDPVTRIEGHMRVEVNVDFNNVIRNAVRPAPCGAASKSSCAGAIRVTLGPLPSGFAAFAPAPMLRPRSAPSKTRCRSRFPKTPIRSAISCSSRCRCTTTSCIFTICMRSIGLMSFRRFPADPKATSTLAQSISIWPLSSPGYFKDLQLRLKKFVASGQLGPFKNGYWGSAAYKLPPEANLMAVAHYLEALDFQKEIVKVHTIFGGKNPHPNWLVGGVPCAINIDGTAPSARSTWNGSISSTA